MTEDERTELVVQRIRTMRSLWRQYRRLQRSASRKARSAWSSFEVKAIQLRADEVRRRIEELERECGRG